MAKAFGVVNSRMSSLESKWGVSAAPYLTSRHGG